MPSRFYQSELVSSTYDLLTDEAEQIEGDLEFYKDCAKRFGYPVLELGVGTGRVAWMLAEAGYNVVGLDLSESMLLQAKHYGSKLPFSTKNLVDLHQGDMADFSFEGKFRLAIIPFSTFNHLTTPAAQRSCLKSVRRHLEPNGRLVIDMFDPILDACAENTVTPNPPRTAWDSQNNVYIRRRSIKRTNDPLTQTFRETFRVERLDRDGQLLDFAEPVHHLRWTTRQEMVYLFELTGFEVEESYGDFQQSAPSYGSRQIWVVKRTSSS